MNEVLEKYKIFWQYAVITEKTFYLQNKENPIYVGIPWATIAHELRTPMMRYI